MTISNDSFLLPCTPDLFWRIFLDPAYLRALYLEELKYKGFEILEITDALRKLRIVPNFNLPGPIEALIGESFAYEEHGTLDRAHDVWTWRMVQPKDLHPAAKPREGLVAALGSVRIEATSEHQCRRSNEVVIEANIFGLGGLIESIIEKEFRAAWVKETALLTRWIDTLLEI
jgi:Protein of unknown function (DUF2505)